MQRILTFNWITQQFTKQDEKLNGNRSLSSCAALQKQNSPIVAAVAGGLSSK